jgi:hypothetical protein
MKSGANEVQKEILGAADSTVAQMVDADSSLAQTLENSAVRTWRSTAPSWTAPYGGKHEKGVRLKDQALADLFDEFSRAKWRPVSNAFWKANLNVMKAASDLAKAILDTLILLHNTRSASR